MYFFVVAACALSAAVSDVGLLVFLRSSLDRQKDDEIFGIWMGWYSVNWVISRPDASFFFWVLGFYAAPFSLSTCLIGSARLKL